MGRKGYYEKTRLILKLKATKKMARNTTRLNPNNVAIAANIEQARLVAGFLLSVAATSGYKRLQAATSGYKRYFTQKYPKPQTVRGIATAPSVTGLSPSLPKYPELANSVLPSVWVSCPSVSAS